MRIRFRIVFILLFGTSLLVGSCTPRPVRQPPPPTVRDPVEIAFSEAEDHFRNRAWKAALEGYRQVVRLAPGGPRAESARWRAAASLVALEENGEAIAAYERFVSHHADSPRTDDARIEILALLSLENRHREVILQGAELLPAILDGRLAPEQSLRVYTLVGGAYAVLGMPGEAIDFYYRALPAAGDGLRSRLRVRIDNAATEMSVAELLAVAERLEEPSAAGDLLARNAAARAADERYLQAAELMEALAQRWPHLPQAARASDLAAEYRGRSVYDRSTVGCLLPLSGAYRAYGQRALRGVEMALTRFGDRGVRVVFRDTASNPDRARKAVGELHRLQVAAIVGPIATAEPAARRAQELGIPILVLTQKRGIADTRDFVFRNFLTPETQAASLAAYACGELGMRRFAILYPADNYGRTFMNLFWDRLLDCGAEVTGVESYRPGQTDFADGIRKLVGLYYDPPADLAAAARRLKLENRFGELLEGAGVDSFSSDAALAWETEDQPVVDFEAVFIPDAPGQAGLIIPQLAFYDVSRPLLLGTNLWHNRELIDMAPEFVQGAVLTAGFFAASPDPRVREFVERFTETYGHEPGFIEAVAYDSMHLLLESVVQPGILSRGGLRDALLDLRDFEGLTGPTTFTADGDVRKGLHLLRIAGKGFAEVAASPPVPAQSTEPTD